MRNPEIGYAYMQKTFYELDDLFSQGHGQEGDPDEPLKFKIYQGVPRYPLSQSLPLTLGDPRRAFSDNEQAAETPLNLTTLSLLLYYTFGFSRHDSGTGVSWPFHRLAPSARCFYPNELYLCIPATDSLPAGIYHYDNLHHSLACLREGDHREILSAVMGADLRDSPAVLLVSAYFWKNAFRYRNFSYRLCSQEAGIVSGNALLVAGTLGFQGTLHYQFLDRAAHSLLGFEPMEESLFTAISLSPARSKQAFPHPVYGSFSSAEMLEEIETISPDYIRSGKLDREKCSLFLELDQHSLIEHPSEFVTAPANAPDALTACAENEHRLFPPSPLKRELDLAEALHKRHSGDMFFLPLQQPLAQESFWEIVRYGLSPYTSDLSAQKASPRAQLYIVANEVEGVERGIYRLCQQCGALHVIEQRDLRQDMLWIHNSPAIHCHTAAMVCFVVADYTPLSALYGNRAYRIMNMESGIIAQRLGVMSAAFGLAARCSDSYHIQRCEALLKLTDQPAMPIFLVAIGYEKAGAGGRYRHKIRF